MAFGLLVWALLPSGVTAVSDDFSYYRSVVETLQHHRPWTNEFLEPWAAGLSGLSAVAFWATGSFQFATEGVLVALAGIAFWAGSRLLMRRGLSSGGAMIAATLILTFPTALGRIVEFNSVALYVPCLLVALLAAEEQRWGWFAVSWLFALSTRQTAIMWGIIPVIAACQAARRRDEARDFLIPVAVAVVGLFVFAALVAEMNQTWAQLTITKPQIASLGLRLRHLEELRPIARRFAVGMAVFLLAAAAGAWIQHPLLRWKLNRAACLRVAIGLMLVAAWFLFARHWTPKSIGFRGAPASWYFALIFAVALVPWLGGAVKSLDLTVSICACISWAAISLHPYLVQYYFLEIAIFGIFAAKPLEQESTAVDSDQLIGRFRTAAAAVLLGINALWVVNLKLAQDVQYAEVRLIETSLRSGQLHIGEIAAPPAPIGLQLWHLVPYAYSYHNRVDVYGKRFRPSLQERRGSVTLAPTFGWPLCLWPGLRSSLRSEQQTDLGKESFRCGWFFRGELALLRERATGVAQSMVDPTDYRPHLFPLNDQEWRDLIAAPVSSKPVAKQ